MVKKGSHHLSFVPSRDIESHATKSHGRSPSAINNDALRSVVKPTFGSSVFGSSIGSISTHSSTRTFNTTVTGVLNRALGEHVPVWANHAPLSETDSPGVIRFWLIAFVITTTTVILGVLGIVTALVAKAFLENQVLSDVKELIPLLPVGHFVGMNIGIGLSFLVSLIACVMAALGGLGYFTSAKVQASRSPFVHRAMKLCGIVFSVAIVVAPAAPAAAVASFAWGLNVRGVYLYYLVSYLMMLLRASLKSLIRSKFRGKSDDAGAETETSALVQVINFVLACACKCL
jgi:hypothetical protein